METRPSARHTKDFKRVYKACEPCRKKKIRCVLEGDGNPPRPPCVRCKRELKECFFSAERSTRRRSERLGQARSARHGHDQRTMSPSASVGERRIVTPQCRSSLSEDMAFPPAEDLGIQQPVADSTRIATQDDGLAGTVVRTLVSSGSDTLKLLFQAAEQTYAEGPQHATSDSHTSHQGDFATPGSRSSISTAPIQRSQASPELLALWNAFRFAKMGWFTAQEAITLVDLFFKNLAPLSPVCQDFETSHDSHFTLITQEPLLCCTILMISSRYHILPGAGGVTRSTLIHQRLWEHCQHLVTRIMFGQEKRSKAKIRTLGSIEALLLTVEWHPKAIHFPPAVEGWDSEMLLTTNDSRDNPLGNQADNTDDPKVRWLDEVVTPARMSDRMSWALLGCAQSLAHELGICDMNSKSEQSPSSRKTAKSFRGLRIRKLLFLFLETLSFRIGCASTVSTSLRACLSEPLTNADESAYVTAWIELTNFLRTITDVLFPSASGAKQLLVSCRYINAIKHFQQQLMSWKAAHLNETKLKEYWYHELLIEFNHARILTNSLGMQATVDRVLGETGFNVGQPDVIYASLTATDYGFIQEVLEGSCQILRCVNKLAAAGTLSFCPVRIFLRIAGASIFLLKALGLGSHTVNVRASLATLEKSIRALHSSGLDDMHLASRYAALLHVHVFRFRQCLIPSSAPRGIPPPEVHGSGSGGDGAVAQAGGDFSFNFESPVYDWLSLPFDPSMAPFDLADDAFDLAESEDNLWDLSWNLPTM